MQTIILLMVLNFYGSSAFPYRSEGVFQNPASIGLTPGFEAIVDFPDTQTSPIYFGVMLGYYGFGYSKFDTNYTYYYSTGFKIANGTFLGFGLSKGERYSYRLGLIKRFRKFLTLNGYGEFSQDKYVFHGRAGIRLLDGVVKFYGRISYSNSVEGYGGGLIFQPVRGLNFTFDADKDGNLGVGIMVNTGNLGLGFRGRGDSIFTTVLVSRERYESAIKLRRKRRVEVILTGKYPEVRKFRLFSYSPSFFDLVEKFDNILKDDGIKEVLIELRNPHLTLNQAEELRNIVARMKFKGKKVYFFSSVYNPITYYLASAGSEIYIQTVGDVMIPGFVATKFYFLDLMKKLGIEAELYHIKEYKSAVEPFTRSNISRYDSLQTMELLKDFMKEFVSKVSASRGMSEDSLEMLMDSIGYFNADEALKYGLVDKIVHETDVEENGKRVRFIPYRKKKIVDEGWEKPVIALITAEGSIINGKSSNGLFGSTIGSETMVDIVRKLRKDKNVKAVVLRINSGGGDAIASEIMWQELMKLREVKPLIVSMGWLAASGGYYISAPGTKIFADNTTITGSIGILGGKVVFKDFVSKIGVNTKILKTNRMADAYSPFRKFTGEEWDILEKELKWGYNKFVSRVSECRGISKDSVNTVGRGHVWSGMRAKQIGLVDKIGGLNDAIREAAKLAGIKGEFEIKVYSGRRMFLGSPASGLNSYMRLLNAPCLYMLPYWMNVR